MYVRSAGALATTCVSFFTSRSRHQTFSGVGVLAKPRVGATDAASGEGEPPGEGAILSFVSTREESFSVEGVNSFWRRHLVADFTVAAVSAATALLLPCRAGAGISRLAA